MKYYLTGEKVVLSKSTKERKAKMSYKYIIDGLASLESHPDLIEYIKAFDGSGGFMFTAVTDPAKKQLEKRLDNILDPNGMHSGGSWGFMLRGIQAVLCGTLSRDYFIEKMAQEEEAMNRFHEETQEAQEAELEAQEEALAAAEAAAQKEAAVKEALKKEAAREKTLYETIASKAAALLSRINTIE